jgi:Regulator of chromosome condensation (RCC1) repeat
VLPRRWWGDVQYESAVPRWAQGLFGRYLLRGDGALLYESDTTSATDQTPILDANTGLPLAGVTDAMEGYAHGCAVLGGDHSAWCWRTAATGNSSGQLGSGVIDTSGPLFRATRVLTAANQPLENVIAISTVDTLNTDAACAVTSAGNVYCWGNDTWLTNGGATLASPYALPITTDGVTALTGALQIAINGTYACTVVTGTSSNEVWCWGQNTHGQLGTGDTANQHYPKKVVGPSHPIKVITYGSLEYLARTCIMDGTNVRCWGGNGSLGAGALAPTLVALTDGTTALGNVVDIGGAATSNVTVSTCAQTGAGTLLCWGVNPATAPAPFGVGNVVSLGTLAGGVHILTSDGLYHIAATTRNPNCGLLQ